MDDYLVVITFYIIFGLTTTRNIINIINTVGISFIFL